MATLTINPTSSVDGNAVITGTTDAVDGARVTLDIRPDGGGTITDLYHGPVYGGKCYIPTNPIETAASTITASSQILNDNAAYVYDNFVWKMQADNTFINVYWEGSSHVDADGAIYGRISTDNRATWGTKFLIHDTDGAGVLDTRNIGGGVNPSTGEIIVFFSDYSTALATRSNLQVLFGSADGSTWTAPADVSPCTRLYCCVRGDYLGRKWWHDVMLHHGLNSDNSKI